MEWKTSWSYLPVDYNTVIGTLENVTQRTVFWNNVDGEKVRILFSNKYSDEDIVFDRVVIGIREGKEVIHATEVTCRGRKEILIPGGSTFYSDEIHLAVQAGKDIVITCFIKERIRIKCGCANWAGENWYTEYIDERGEALACHEVYPFIAEGPTRYTVLPGISRIEVFTEQKVEQIALFGDSITHMSYYCNALMKALYRKFPGRMTIANCGYGGNRILRDASFSPGVPGEGKCAGVAGLKRFEEDVFQYTCPDYVFILEGINDLLHPYVFRRMEELPEAEELIEAYKTFCRKAKDRGAKVCLSTILPCKSEEYPFGEEGEAIRKKVNEWIRTQNFADGVFDFDEALTDADSRCGMKEEFHTGDGLHPNTLGGEAMAEVVLRTMGW